MRGIFKDLAGRLVLVTGATRGIGRAIALSLAESGAHVIFNFREGKKDVADDLAKELMNRGADNVTPLMFDITDLKAMRTQLEDFLKGSKKGISGLVNNAGISKDQLVLRLKDEDISNILDVNLKGAMLLTSIVSRSIMRTKMASIVNVSSVVGLMGNPGQTSYAASKAGLIGFTKSLAKELGVRNVRCNAICPGFIQTDMTGELDPKTKDTYLESIPLKRFGEANEVADLVCFLISDASSYISGETIKIDGGLYI